ncbi:hypothetical protein BJX70DRAFT_71558 [Aspergillus crustosus]
MRTHDDFMRDFAHSSTPHDTSYDSGYGTLPPDEDLSHRKRTRTIHPSHSICRDWMIVSGNCHYARDSASFTTYTPSTTTIKNNIFNLFDEMHVSGVGSVQLTVPATPGDPTIFSTLVLEDVLHIPEAVCNGFNPLLVGSSMSCHPGYWEGKDRMGRAMWFGLPLAGLGRLVLKPGEGEGVSELIEGRQYTLSLYISPEEKGVILGR